MGRTEIALRTEVYSALAHTLLHMPLYSSVCCMFSVNQLLQKKSQLGLRYAALDTCRRWFACEYEPKNDPNMHFLNAK